MTTSFDVLADALIDHLAARGTPPDVIALGEPLHGEPAFLAWWSRALDRLVDVGVRSVALETDAVAALAVDAWVRGGPGTLDDVLATGFTHGFGRRGGMRELVAGLRVRNDERPTADRVAVHGFDLPTEASGAPSPRPYLEHLLAYLVTALGTAPVDAGALDTLLGPDGPWCTWEAQLDAAHSVGGSPEAITLRSVADDLLAALHAEAPRLIAVTSREAWHGAELHGRTALGLLRYHAAAARPCPADERMLRLLGARDEGMARHLLAIRTRERHRGPTAVLAHDRHLQRRRSTWTPADGDAEWTSAGAIVAAVSDEEYVHVAALLGTGPAIGVGAPPAGTLEAAVGDRGGWVVDPATLDGTPARDDVPTEHGYLPLGTETLPGADAVVLVDPATAAATADPSVTDLAARLLSRPGVTHLRADEASGAPPAAHGDWFFHAHPDDRMPFATIVVSDYPGHDETSRLDRPGVFRLNLGVGRDALADVAGVGAPDVLDRFVAHPVYAAQGWLAILCPSAAHLPEIERLVDVALARAHGTRTGG